MQQEYDQYTKESHHVWQLLFEEQSQVLANRATSKFLEGIQTIQFQSYEVPRFTTINKILKELTGWEVYAVPGLIDNKPFFELLAKKQFPATTWLRTLAQLKYIEEPDMFHDVFGHVPLLSEPYFAGFLNGISQIALQHIDNETAIELMARIYWYTIEFGLINENGTTKIYGAGILSSPGESVFSLSADATRYPFDLHHILATPYIKDCYQGQYFVAESYEQLYRSLPQLKEQIEYFVHNKIEVVDGQKLDYSYVK
jgi:phenylalanine-4-hydroxylase